MNKLCKIFLLGQFLFCLSIATQAAPILLNSGDQAIFKFDFSPNDISSVGSIQYQWNTSSIPSTGAFPIFEMNYSIYDELGDAPYYEITSFIFTTTFSHHIANGASRSELFDDPISYIAIDFMNVNGVTPSAVLMDINATVFVASDNSPPIAHAEGVASVPIPATLPLLSIAVGSLYWLRRKRA